jgi:hypothetical protein
LLAEFPRQLCIAGEEPGLQHGGFREHVAIGLRNRFFDRTRGVSDPEATIPEKIKDLLHHFLQVR